MRSGTSYDVVNDAENDVIFWRLVTTLGGDVWYLTMTMKLTMVWMMTSIVSSMMTSKAMSMATYGATSGDDVAKDVDGDSDVDLGRRRRVATIVGDVVLRRFVGTSGGHVWL